MLIPDEPAPRAEIVLYSKADCPYCARAKVMLDKMGKTYAVVTLDDQRLRNHFYDEFKLEGADRTMPQVFVSGDRVGGYHNLVSLVAAGGLQ